MCHTPRGCILCVIMILKGLHSIATDSPHTPPPVTHIFKYFLCSLLFLFQSNRLGSIWILYRIVIWDKTSWQILGIVLLWYVVSFVFSWLKRRHYSNVTWFCELTDCSHCSFIYLYPLIHITDDYWSKMSLGQYFVKSLTVILTVLSQCRGIWSKILWYLLILSPQLLPLLRMHNKSSVTTYMINNHQYRLIWNFTIMIGFSAESPRPKVSWK